ncbi:MAG: hypothetical protein CMF26_04630 [Kiloniella sp.]|nr:hypothetical protein [Kiloniella sp.]
MDQLRIVVAQINPIAGDILCNFELHKQAYEDAANGADLVVFAEASLTGYPIGDLALHQQFVMDCARANAELIALTRADGAPGILFGTLVQDSGQEPPFYAYQGQHRRMKGQVFNAAILAENGEIIGQRFKRSLPTFGPFDEARWFEPGPLQGPIQFRGTKIGVQICDDAWREDGPETLEETGTELLIAMNGSGYTADIMDQRYAAMSRLSQIHGYPVIYTNLVGGQDGMVFDGGGFCINPGGDLAGSFPLAETGSFSTRWMKVEGSWRCVSAPKDEPESGWAASAKLIALGVRDFAEKNKLSVEIADIAHPATAMLRQLVPMETDWKSGNTLTLLPWTKTELALGDFENRDGLEGPRLAPFGDVYSSDLSSLAEAMGEDAPPVGNTETDRQLQALIEDELCVDALADEGFRVDACIDLWKRMARSEFKRRAAPMVLRLSQRALIGDRVYPVTNRYRLPADS